MTKKQEPVFKHIFGPVPSRRLGMSLGVDLVPRKTCSLDCVYCECGPTTLLTRQRQPYIPLDRIKAELDAFLARDPAMDYITFSGAGEPTLHTGLGELVRFLKTAYPARQLALLSNGTLFNEEPTRRDALDLDLVKVSLDAVYKKSFRRINRPHRDLDINAIIEGLLAFRRVYKKQLWVEVFLVAGCNDHDAELKAIKGVIDLLAPDRIQLNTLDRPGSAGWVRPVTKSVLTQVAAYLYNADIIKSFAQKGPGPTAGQDLDERLLETLKRRPCTIEDISRFLGVDIEALRPQMAALLAKGAVTQKRMPRGIFYLKRA